MGENWTSKPSKWIEGFRDSYLEMRFNFNIFYYGIAPFSFEKECYLGHYEQTHEVYPFYTNAWHLGVEGLA